MPTSKNFHNKQSINKPTATNNMNKDLSCRFTTAGCPLRSNGRKIEEAQQVVHALLPSSFMLIPAASYRALCLSRQGTAVADEGGPLAFPSSRHTLSGQQKRQTDRTCRKPLSVYEKEEAYQQNHFAVVWPGEQYIDPRHAFTYDLDIHFRQQPLFSG